MQQPKRQRSPDSDAGEAPRERAIQIPLCIDYDSIWDYRAAFIRQAIDFESVVGPACPICQRKGCWRQISPYARCVIELFPYREGVVEVARFQCTTTRTTFSLLPVQLIPFVRYTASSVVGALLSVWVLVRDNRGHGLGTLLEKDARLLEESRVTAWLLETWLQAVLSGLRRAHQLFARRPDLRGQRSPAVREAGLEQIASYFGTLGVRAPPRHAPGIVRILSRHGRVNGRFLIGIPSQSKAA